MGNDHITIAERMLAIKAQLDSLRESIAQGEIELAGLRRQWDEIFGALANRAVPHEKVSFSTKVTRDDLLKVIGSMASYDQIAAAFPSLSRGALMQRVWHLRKIGLVERLSPGVFAVKGVAR